jgi:hypothetical protein
MKKCSILIIGLILLISCNSKKEVTIRKIPCENIFTYNHAGTLNGTYLTLYFAVEYSDTIPIQIIRTSVDTVFKSLDISKYSGFVCWFLKESSELKKIKNCDITDSHNISSDQHKAIILFTYNTEKKSLEEISYDAGGSYIIQPFRR